MEPETESLPVNDYIKVIEATRIYKTPKWWEVVALVNKAGHDQVSLFQWIHDDKDEKRPWKRRNKFTTWDENEWEKIKEAIDDKMAKLKVIKRGG